MDILTLAKKLDVDVPDFVNNYSNQFPDITELDDIRSEIEYQYYQDHIAEHADSNVPVYYYNIDEEYKGCTVSIDDVINDGLMESMGSEADISKAKQIALYLSIERETMENFYTFIDDMENAVFELDDNVKEQLENELGV